MSAYNVRASVVGVIEAGSADEALFLLRDRLSAMGFDVFEAPEDNAFESEAAP